MKYHLGHQNYFFLSRKIVSLHVNSLKRTFFVPIRSDLLMYSHELQSAEMLTINKLSAISARPSEQLRGPRLFWAYPKFVAYHSCLFLLHCEKFTFLVLSALTFYLNFSSLTRSSDARALVRSCSLTRANLVDSLCDPQFFKEQNSSFPFFHGLEVFPMVHCMF